MRPSQRADAAEYVLLDAASAQAKAVRELESADSQLALFDALDVQANAQAIARRAAQQAIEALDATGLHNPAMDQLRALAAFAVEREH